MAATEIPAVGKEMAAEGRRHYSGVLVVTSSDALSACADAVDALAGVEVHMRHPESARLVAVLEGDSAAGQEERLQQIRAIPGVMLASLVYHYVDENPEAGPEEAVTGGGRQHAE